MTTEKPGVIEISSLENAPVITLNKTDITPATSPKTPSGSSLSSDKPSVNFGGGMELLMNTKRKNDGSKSPGAAVDVGDISNLEKELNDLSASEKPSSEKAPTKSSLFSKMLDGVGLSSKTSDDANNDSSTKNSTQENDDILKLGGSSDNDPMQLNTEPIKIGKHTATDAMEQNSSGSGTEKTWDGFKKFNNVPIDHDLDVPSRPVLSKEEETREKFKMLRKLESIEKKGVKLSRKYSMDSDLREMEGEYEVHLAERERASSAKFQGRMLMAAVTGLEFLNNRFDPFDVKLDGWAEQVNENLDDYDEIFSELHAKYKSKAKMAPELKLLFQLGGSAIMVHMTNTMFKSAMPGMDDIMRQNPELMQQFTQAAADSMGQQHPGFGGFMSGLMQDRPTMNANVAPGPPPEPVSKAQLRSQRSGPMNPRDMSKSRASGLSGDGESLESRFGPASSSTRAEMKGPSDVSELIAGLKSKSIKVPPSGSGDTNSTVSVSEIKQMQTSPAAPVRTKRRQKSDRNVMNLQL